MKITLACLLFVGLLTSGLCTSPIPDTTTSTASNPNTTTQVSSTTEPTTSSTSSSTTASTPTTTVTTTSTEAPTTKPNTTTPETTTTPASTTPIPTTVSPNPPTPELGSWTVKNGNTTCIRADLTVRFKIPVKGRDEYIALSPNATSSGTCNGVNDTQVLSLTDAGYEVTLTFGKDTTSAFLNEVALSYNSPSGSDQVFNDTHLFNVKIGNSYLCSSTSNIELNNVTMEVFYIHIQAYGGEENSFGKAEECEADNKVSDIVPIAVGCALLALVVVVLVAYFVGRRRSRQKGYQSV